MEKTDWNRDERVQGISDIPLNAQGLLQAQRLAEALKGCPLTNIYSSPLSRAYETARIINTYHQLPIALHDALREMDQGRFEGLPFRALMNEERDFLTRWLQNPAYVTMPEGESLADVQSRTETLLETISSKEGVHLITSHSFVISAIICRLLGIPLSRFREFSVSPASLTVVNIIQGRGGVGAFKRPSSFGVRGRVRDPCFEKPFFAE